MSYFKAKINVKFASTTHIVRVTDLLTLFRWGSPDDGGREPSMKESSTDRVMMSSCLGSIGRSNDIASFVGFNATIYKYQTSSACGRSRYRITVGFVVFFLKHIISASPSSISSYRDSSERWVLNSKFSEQMMISSHPSLCLLHMATASLKTLDGLKDVDHEFAAI